MEEQSTATASTATASTATASTATASTATASTATASIAHVALWCRDLDVALAFWTRWFTVAVGPLYVSERRPFRSRFIRFADGCRIELMESPLVVGEGCSPSAERLGWGHVAVALADEAAVDRLAAAMEAEGVDVVGRPRRTGDGYYEAVILDPEGNRIELVVDVALMA